MSSGKVFLGLLVGITAGAVLGILFAPEKGSETRKKISKKSEDYADALKEKFGDILDSVSGKLDDVKDEVSNLAGKISKSDGAKKNVKDAKS